MSVGQSTIGANYLSATTKPTALSAFTMAGWFQIKALPAGLSVFFSVGVSGTAFADLALTSAGVLEGVANAATSASVGTFAVGDWVYAAISQSGTTLTTYASKNNAASVTVTSAADSGTPTTTRCLSDATSHSAAFADHVRVWNVALTKAQLDAERDSPNAVLTAGLLSDSPLPNTSTLGDWAITGSLSGASDSPFITFGKQWPVPPKRLRLHPAQAGKRQRPLAFLAAGAQQFTQTLTISQGSSLAMARQAGVIKSPTQATSLSALRGVGKILPSISQGNSTTLVKLAAALKSLTQATVATLPARVVSIFKSISQTTALSMGRTLTRVFNLVQSPSILLPRAITITKSISQSNVGTLLKRPAHSLSVSQATAAALSKFHNAFITLALFAGSAVSLPRVVSAAKSVGQGQSAVVAKVVGIVRSAAQATTATLARLKVILVTLLSSIAGSVVLVRAVSTSRTVSQSAAAGAVKMVSVVKSLAQATVTTLPGRLIGKGVTLAQSSSLSLARACKRMFTLSQAVSSSLVRSITHSFSTTQGTALSLTRLVGWIRSIGQSVAATLVVGGHLPVQLVLTVTQATAPTMRRLVEATRNVTQSASLSIARAITTVRSVSSSVSVTVLKRANILRTTTVSTLATLTHGAVELLTLVTSVATVASVTHRFVRLVLLSVSAPTTALMSKAVATTQRISMAATFTMNKSVTWLRTLVQSTSVSVAASRLTRILLTVAVGTVATLTHLFEKFYGATQRIQFPAKMVAAERAVVLAVKTTAMTVSATAVKFVTRALRMKVEDKD